MSEQIPSAPSEQNPPTSLVSRIQSFARMHTAWTLTGVAVVFLIILLGLYMWLAPNNAVRRYVSEAIYGELPISGVRPAGPFATPDIPRETSGLSGIACENPNRRPIGVMLAGDPINRPMSGFSKADMVFELPVLVSNVTRLTGVYQCGEPTDIGSVRSVRHDYLFLLEGIDGIMAHWGGSYHALNRISVGEFQTLNALTNPHNAFFRKNHLPAPYNGFTTYERLWNALEKLGYRTTTNFKGYDFKDDIPPAERVAGGTLSVGWPGAFRVSYEYNAETNRYERYWAGVRQIDAEDNQVVAPSTIAVMRATNTYADGDGGYNDVAIEGTGDVTVYQDGKAIVGTWRKNELEKKDPIHFLNDKGDPIIFTKGQVWIMAVEPTTQVTWEPK